MRVVVQRVQSASVSIAGNVKSEIGQGLMVLLGFEDEDSEEDLNWMAGKIARLRVFDDTDGVMNKSIADVGGAVLAVSQFTLHASTKKGNRPSYLKAAKPEISIPLYEQFLQILQTEYNLPVQSGEFGADMQVALINDGPVTIIMDSKNKN